MIILAPTIMGSGTNLLHQEIFKGFKHCRSGSQLKDEDTYLKSEHITGAYFKTIKEQAKLDYPIIMPLRHPRRIKECFIRWGRPQSMEEQWDNVMELDYMFSPYYIHVDQPKYRDTELDIINNKLGLNLKTEWPLVRSMKGTHAIKLDDLPEVDQKYIDFYYETIDKMIYHG